jgi:hypothetical protein
MLGCGAKMLSCPVLKQFAVLSSRRLQSHGHPSREIKKASPSIWLFRSWTGLSIYLLEPDLLIGWPSIPQERLLRGLLLHAFYTVRDNTKTR